MAKVKGVGRAKASRNRSYFDRRGRGWYAKFREAFVALEYENNDRMRDQNTLISDVKAAYLRAVAK